MTEAHLAAIEALNPRLNAFITVTPDVARLQADRADRALAAGDAGPLTGHSAGDQGSVLHRGRAHHRPAARSSANFVPPYESTVSAQLLRDGAVFLGKANLDEFAMGSSNMTSAFGAVENPWKRRQAASAVLVPGGSSGGSASAVAARLAHGATGTDTGGSIRQPAAFCGLAGMKPTYGRCSRWGIGGVRLLAGSGRARLRAPCADCAMLLRSMAGLRSEGQHQRGSSPVPDYEAAACGRGVKGLRIGVPREYRMEGMPGGSRRCGSRA